MMTAKQLDYLRDLMADVRRLMGMRVRWVAMREAEEGKRPPLAPGEVVFGDEDWAAWFGGFVAKHRSSRQADVYFHGLADVEKWIDTRTPDHGRRLIAALADARDRLDASTPREALETPKPMLTAIWTAAKRGGLDRDLVGEIVGDVTGGATTSTKHLRRAEALDVLRRLGGSTRVFEMQPPRSPGGRPGMAEKRWV